MRKMLYRLIVLIVMMVVPLAVQSTPSSTVWTNCTIDFQSPKSTRLTCDSYSRFGNPVDDSSSQFPTDYGLTWGKTLGDTGLALEYGFDYFSPASNPIFFNAKIGYPENVLFDNAPALELGLFNFGTKSGITSQNIAQLITGKTLPNNLGRLHGSVYVGNGDVLVSSDGKKSNTGFMLAYDKMITGKLWFGTDYASGRNAIGGYSAAIGYYFTPDISILAGPVWFNDTGINGKMKITVQLDLNF